MEFNGKKIYIAPHTPKTTMFAKELQERYSFQFLGFIDNFKEGESIIKPQAIAKEYDLVLIVSQNHGNIIYKELSKKLPQKKLIKVETLGANYNFLNKKQMDDVLAKEGKRKQKQNFLKNFTKLLDLIWYKRFKIVFISKDSITSNNKALFISCYKKGLAAWMLTDNNEQYKILKDHKMPVILLDSWHAYLIMGQARVVIQDQANLTEEISLLSPKQKRLQLWHGIPLKRLNKLTTVSYNYLVSTSDFVNKTTLSHVIDAKEYKAYGYPRNDLFLKQSHDDLDLLFCDRQIYKFAKKSFGSKDKIAIYMPTHRESNKAAKIPLDFKTLNTHLQKIDTTLILKLHHFSVDLNEEKKSYSHILFHSAHGDIYPLLKYVDILISDYSSVYFDFLLLNRPIIFFDYDKEEYEENMQGFLYDYREFTPGVHVKNQEELELALCNWRDGYKEQRAFLATKLYTHLDAGSSARISQELLS